MARVEAKERRARRRGAEVDESKALSSEEQARYEEQKRDICARVNRTKQHIVDEYELGAFCLQVRESGLWRRDPANDGCNFVQSLCRITGRPGSLSTFDRRIRLVQHYTLDGALALFAEGVDLLAMVECTYGAPALRPMLLELARTGLPISQLIAVRQAGNKRLKGEQNQGQGGSLAEAFLAMQEALLRVKKEDGAEEEASGEEEEGGLAGREAQLAQREREVGQREQRVAALQQELEARAAELEAQREQLKLREEAGLGPGAGELDEALEARLKEVQKAQVSLLRAQEQLKEERKKLALWHAQTEEQAARVKAGQAEVEAGREEIASRLRQSAQEIETAKQVAARLVEVEERERAVAAQGAALAQREEEVGQKEAEVAGREAGVLGKETEMAGRDQALRTREELVRTEQAEIEETKGQIRVVLEEVNRRKFEVERKARYDGRIEWEDPWTMDDALNQAAAYLFRAMKMGDFLLDRLERGELPTIAGCSGLFEVAEGLAAARRAMNDALPRLTEEYERRYPDQAAAAMEEWKKGKAAAEIALHHKLGKKTDGDGGNGGGAGPGGSSAPPSDGAEVPMVKPAVILGTEKLDTPQVGLLGVDEQGRVVGLCLNEIQSISVCGQQNFGKSVTLQILAEMMVQRQPGISKTPQPLAVMVAHYDHGGGYASSFAKVLGPNPDAQSLAWLRKKFGAGVTLQGLKRLKVYVPPNLTPRQMEQRRREYPGAEILPIRLNMASLRTVGIRLVLAAEGNASLYIKQVEHILSKMGDNPTLERLEVALEKADLQPGQRRLIRARLSFLRDYVTDGPDMVSELAPGDLVIFDLRHDFLDKDTALALFAVLMDAHADTRDKDGKAFNKAFIFDEAHKFMSPTSPIREQVANSIKEMRHRHTWVIIATQDPRSAPKDVNALSTVTIVHRISDKDMLKEMQRRNMAWEPVTIQLLGTLGQAEVMLSSTRATDAGWVQVPHKVFMRPPCSAPGGTTRTAV